MRDRNPAQQERPPIEGQRPLLPNHRHRRGSVRLLHHKPSKQAIAQGSSVQHRRRGRTGRFCPDDGVRSRRGGLGPSTSHTMERLSQPRLLPKRHPSTAPTFFGRRDTLGAQPTGHCTRQSFLLGPECRTTTWMESPLGQSGTGPRPFERLFLSCPGGSFSLLCLPSPGGSRKGAAMRCRRGFERMPTRLPCIGRYAYGVCRLGLSASPYLGKLLYDLSLRRFPSTTTYGRMCPQGVAHTAPWKDQKLTHPDTQRGQDDAWSGRNPAIHTGIW